MSNHTNSKTQLLFLDDWIKICYVIIGILGFVMNSLVLLVMWKTPRLYSKTLNLMITNQSILDILAAVILIAYSSITDSSVANNGMASQIYCRVWMSASLLWGLLYASTNNLIVITIERYLNVVHTMWHKATFTRSRAKVMLVVGWVIGFVIALCHGVLTSTIDDEHKQCRIYATWNKSDRIISASFFLVFTFLLPLMVFIFCYGRMVYVIEQRMKNGFQFKGNHSCIEEGVCERWYQAKMNIIHTLCIVSFLFVACWSWNQVYVFVISVLDVKDTNSNTMHLTVLAAFLTCSLNPFVYVLKYKQFRYALLKIFCKKCYPNLEIFEDNTCPNSIQLRQKDRWAVDTRRKNKSRCERVKTISFCDIQRRWSLPMAGSSSLGWNPGKCLLSHMDTTTKILNARLSLSEDNVESKCKVGHRNALNNYIMRQDHSVDLSFMVHDDEGGEQMQAFHGCRPFKPFKPFIKEVSHGLTRSSPTLFKDHCSLVLNSNTCKSMPLICGSERIKSSQRTTITPTVHTCAPKR